jgi:hypothetical protein
VLARINDRRFQDHSRDMIRISRKTQTFKGLARSAETINSASLQINKGRATAYNVVVDTGGAIRSRGIFSTLGSSIHAERRATSDSRLPLRKEEGLRDEKFQGGNSRNLWPQYNSAMWRNFVQSM